MSEKSSSTFESYESSLKKLNAECPSIEVFHYYNKHYSQTGGVYRNLEKALDHARQDNIIDKSEYKNIEKKINKKGYYEIFQFYIRKINMYGNTKDGLFDFSKFKGDVYILRYPEIAFTSNEKAYEIGLKYVLSKKDYLTPNDDGRIYDHYTWGRKKDFQNKTRTECNKEWVKEVLEDYACIDKPNFFKYIAGRTPYDTAEYDNKWNFVWEELWKARIEENEWSCENHIEDVDNDRVEL